MRAWPGGSSITFGPATTDSSSASRGTTRGFPPKLEALLVRYRVARVAADPPPGPGAVSSGGWPGLVYFRLHGAPRKYSVRVRLRRHFGAGRGRRQVPRSVDAWCVFDNTASGAALDNAWELQTLLQPAHRVG